ncbi:MAG: parallel beta-helix domain-containing protein [Parvibaculaceae bacterium]
MKCIMAFAAASAALFALGGGVQAATLALDLTGEGIVPQEAIQEALIDVEPGDTILLPAGTFALTDGLSLDIDGVTIRGQGPDATVLSFKGQEAGGEGLLVTSDRIVLEGFAIEDVKGDAIKSNGSDEITFRDIRVEWTNGPAETNGAYGLYPVSSTHVLIENCVAIGASDAGIYVGQSQYIVVRNSRAEYNVAGIEIENSYYADVYGNVATHNTGGILVFDLPGLPQQGGHSIRVFDNRAVDNDTPNFAPEGNIVGDVPMGTGIMVMANRDVELFGNEIDGNATTGILIVAYPYETDDEAYEPFPEGIHIHGNRIGRNGFAPDNEIGEMVAEVGGTPVADIVWDGRLPWWETFFGPAAGEGIYLGANESTDGEPVTFANLDVTFWYAARWLHGVEREAPDHAGEPALLEPVTLNQMAN